MSSAEIQVLWKQNPLQEKKFVFAWNTLKEMFIHIDTNIYLFQVVNLNAISNLTLPL